ncbi:PBP1A family penicillin-binding protein [soil metagenome]
MKNASKSSDPPRLKWGGWRPWWDRVRTHRRKIAWGALGAVGVGVILFALAFLHYHRRASAFDLERLATVRKGSAVEDASGREIGRIFGENQKPVTLEEVPSHLLDALIATEDKRFYEHSGLDLRAVVRAALANIKAGGIDEGGSTITQQLSRQAFGLSGRTFDRKFTEAFIARRVEGRFTKEEILERYLNRIYLGDGYYGMGAAARGYFGKDVGALEPAESALLVGIIKAPNSFSPRKAPELAERARNLTLHRMVELGMITEAEREARRSEPVETVAQEAAERPSYLIAAVREEARSLVPGIETQSGLTVVTSANVTLQDALTREIPEHLASVEERFGNGGDAPLQAAVVVIGNETGDVLASVGGRDFLVTQFDRAWSARRPAGTAFAPWVFAAAFQSRAVAPFDGVLDVPLDNEGAMVGGTAGILGEWGAESAVNTFEGQVSAAYALLRTKNAATVRVGTEAGIPVVQALATAVGINSELRNYPSLFLGASEVGVAEMASASTVFPRGGVAPASPHLITRIYGPGGDPVYERPASGDKRVLEGEVAEQMVEILNARLRLPHALGVVDAHGLEPAAVAGFGGTAHGFTDAWFVGFDRNLTCAVWVGYDESRSVGELAFSREVAMPLWAKTMRLASGGGRGAGALVDASGADDLCVRSGRRTTDACLADGMVAVGGAALTGDASADPGEDCEMCDRPDGEEPAVKILAQESRPAQVGVKPDDPVVVGGEAVKSFFW